MLRYIINRMREASYYEKREEGKVQCFLCPHNCLIAAGKSGRCGTRTNRDGTLFTEVYARATSIALDPIEKKPLYHFYPGTLIFSMGTWGCNFSCPFCQNWSISQRKAATQEVPPTAAVSYAQSRDSVGIAYTYNEPLIWFEYVLDTAKLARSEGLKNVLVTNGYINPEPLLELLPYIDALNIDLKSMDDEFYAKLCGAKLEPVLQTIKTAHQEALVELTNLIIPGWNDRDENFVRLRDWICKELDPDVPLHLSAYYPRYKLQAPPTPLGTLERAYEICSEKLNFVYLGNVLTEKGSSTLCKGCGATLIRRTGYHTTVAGLADSSCAKCGATNNIVR